MISAVSGPSFSRADILPAIRALAWSSLPIVADQLAQRIFFKKTPVDRSTDLTITGLITCAFIICFLPPGSPARIGAPVLYLAYRAALSYWNRKPKPKARPQPNLRKPPAKKDTSRTSHHRRPESISAEPTTTPKPPAQQPASHTQSHSDGPTAAAPTAPPKSPEGIKSAQNSRPSSTLAPIPTITFTPASPRGNSEKKAPPKSEEKKAETSEAAGKPTPPSAKQKAQLDEANRKGKALIEKADRLKIEMLATATRIKVKVKITYLPKQETDSDPQEKKSIPKEPVIISKDIYINPTCVFKFPKEMIPTLQTRKNIPYSITENTSFCWIFLLSETPDQSIFPFDYLPTTLLSTLNKKMTVLKLETKETIFEIEFLKAGSHTVDKCLNKLNKCTRVEFIQPKFAMIPLNFKDDPDGLMLLTRTALTLDNCY